MSDPLVEIIWLTLRVAAISTLIVAVPGILLGYVLARYRFVGCNILSTLIGLPLVLPPTAVGYILLRTLAVDGPLGKESLGFDLGILLTWKAAVIAAAVMSIPLVARTARVTFEGIDPRLESMARTLGHGRLETFLRFSIPMARRGLLASLILGFTRAVGEFGATVTIAGNIPGRTQTLASAIFTAQQVGDNNRAYTLMWIATGLGFVAILSSEWLSQRKPGTGRGR